MSARSRRNARLALTIAALVALELAWRATASPDDPRVVRADFGASAAALLVLSAINFLSGLFKGKVDPNVARSLEGLRSGLVDLGKAILEGLTAVAWRFAQVWDWLRKWFGRIFRELADVIGAVVKRLSRILDRVLGPVIDFLDKVRKHVWAIYNDIVKPILDIIEFIRLPLKILSAFNVEWAKRLDATLANLEDWIVDQFTFVMGRINYVMNALNDIMDVERLLKRFTFMRTVIRDVRYINQVLLMSRFKAEDSGAIGNRRRRLNKITFRDVQRNTEIVLLTGDGPYGSFVREMSAQWKIDLRDAGF